MKNTNTTRATASWAATLVMMLATLVTGACTATVPTPSVRNRPVPEGHAEGADLYRQHCGRCHDLYEPSRYTDFQWSTIMPQMIRESNLDQNRGAKISSYLKAANG